MSFLPRLLRPSSVAGPSRLALPSAPLPLSFTSSIPRSAPFSTTPVVEKYKLKSHSGSKKRFFANGSGAAQAGKSHLNTPISASKINRLARATYTTRTQTKLIKKMLPFA
ncbi:ribosomal protein L35 [Cryptococcus sp. DSM 104549]